MFTGLVRCCGSLIDEPRSSEQGGVLLRLGFGQDLVESLPIGASLAVSGVCLTIVSKAEGEVSVELSPETLSRTTLGELQKGSRVNLEPALHMGDAMGGHWVQGHVDTTTEVVERRDLGDHVEMSFALDEALAPFVVEKGSVTIDGVSLTIASLGEDRFSIALIPHTLEVTTLGDLGPSDRVNIEVDILAKYVQRALSVSGAIAD